MAKQVAIQLGFAAGIVNFPLAVYAPSMSLANYKGFITASFDAAGNTIFDVDSLTVNASDQLIFIGTNYNGTPAASDRQIAVSGVVVDI